MKPKHPMPGAMQHPGAAKAEATCPTCGAKLRPVSSGSLAKAAGK
jgi:hypothetical protein